MDWIQEPKGASPDDACGIHLCSARSGEGSCVLRFCLTKYCIIDH